MSSDCPKDTDSLEKYLKGQKVEKLAVGAGEMAEKIKALTTKLDNLSFCSKTNMVEGKNQVL